MKKMQDLKISSVYTQSNNHNQDKGAREQDVHRGTTSTKDGVTRTSQATARSKTANNRSNLSISKSNSWKSDSTNNNQRKMISKPHPAAGGNKVSKNRKKKNNRGIQDTESEVRNYVYNVYNVHSMMSDSIKFNDFITTMFP